MNQQHMGFISTEIGRLMRDGQPINSALNSSNTGLILL